MFTNITKGMERLDQLTAAPDVFQTDESVEPNMTETVAKLQEEVKELKKQTIALQTVCIVFPFMCIKLIFFLKKCQVYENEVNYYTNVNQQQQDEISEKARELERLRKEYKSNQNLKEVNKTLTAEVL